MAMIVKSSHVRPFEKKSNSHFSFFNDNVPIKKAARDLYSAYNIFLWSHGIGFSHGMKLTRKHLIMALISYFLMFLLEGNFLLVIWGEVSQLIKNTIDGKRKVALIMVKVLTFMNRVSIYAKRKNLKTTLVKLGKIYDQVGDSGLSIKKFRLKITVLLYANDFLTYYLVGIYLSLKVPQMLQTHEPYGVIQYPLAIPSLIIQVSLNHVVHTHSAVMGYFCCVCFLLKESLIALNKRLQRHKDKELEPLFDLHCETAAVISDVNDFFHPSMLLSSSIVLLLVFRDVYDVLFSSVPDFLPSGLRLLYVSSTFSQFVFLCLYGSFVINAAGAAKGTAEKLPVKLSQLRSLHVVSTMKNGIGGFNFFNSILIDSSLILSAVGSLMSYGILIATFSTSNEAANKGNSNNTIAQQ